MCINAHESKTPNEAGRLSSIINLKQISSDFFTSPNETLFISILYSGLLGERSKYSMDLILSPTFISSSPTCVKAIYPFESFRNLVFTK